MPRRTVQKCTRRHAGDRLSVTTEFCLTEGHAFDVREWEEPLRSRAEFRRLWSRWSDEVEPRWIEAFPGSRPIGTYVVGGIEPPDWMSEYPALRHPVVIEGQVVIEDRSWHMGEVELDHLVALGVVGDRERRLAIQRLDEPDARQHIRYRLVSDD